MSDYRISKNYAKALFMLASEFDKTDVVAGDMRLVSKVFAENRELHVVFKNPTIKQDKKSAVVDALFAGKVDEVTMQFMHFVVRKNRIVNMRGIASSYLTMYRADRGIVLADVTAAYEVNDELATMVRTIVGKISGKTVEVVPHADHRIIGGFVLKFDNKMFDTRIRTKLAMLRNHFSENEFESKL